MEGEEFIQLSFCDGKNIVHCPVVKDFKKISKNSEVNTGSMGCIVQKNQNYKNVEKKILKKVMITIEELWRYYHRWKVMVIEVFYMVVT